jgi:hypothetical protein
MAGINKFKVLLSIPWGDGETEIGPEKIDFPGFSDMSPGQMRKVFAPVPFMVDAGRCCHVSDNRSRSLQGEDALYIHHFNPDGLWIGRTPVPGYPGSLERRRIVDFAVNPSMDCYILERTVLDNSTLNRLIRVDKEGNIIWEQTGTFQKDTCDFNGLKGNFNKLLVDKKENLYLTSAAHMNTIARLDTAVGDVSDIYTLGHSCSHFFMNEKGVILGIAYFEKQNRRGLLRFDPASGKEEYTIAGADLFGLLLFPFGYDNNQYCYLYKVPNVYEEPAVVSVSPGGGIINREGLKDLVIRPHDHAVFAAIPCGDEFNIAGYFPDGSIRHWTIRPQPDDIPADISGLKLINVDEKNRFYILSGEQPGDAGKLSTYAEDTTPLGKTKPPEDLSSIESTLLPYTYWQVDGDGNIYFPATTPAGFNIVRLKSGA